MKETKLDLPKIELSLLDNSQDVLWEEFLSKSINYTFYQDLKFIDFYAHKVKEVKKILFKKNGKPLALFAGGICEKNGVLEMRSPFSASFGGFCCTDVLKLQEALDIVEALLDYCKAQGISRILIRQTPQIYYRNINEYMDFALVLHNFKIANSDITLFVDCIENPLETFGPTARNIIRRSASEGFRFEETPDASEVFELIESNKLQKGLKLFMTKEELLNLRGALDQKIKLFIVKSGKETICSSVIYMLNKKTMLVMFWAQKESWAKKSPTYFLIHELARYGYANDYSFLDFGTATIGGKPVWGVTDFKEKFNPSGVIRKEFVKEIGK